MDSAILSDKPHAFLVPYPTQGHITPMLKLAKLLHSHGFHITFVNSDFNHGRLLRSQGNRALAGLPDFRFEAIPDGLPPSDSNATQDVVTLCASIQNNFMLTPLIDLIKKLNSSNPSSGIPRVSRIVADGLMSFCIDAGDKLGIPVATFWSASAAGLLGYLQFQVLIDRGIFPLKDESYLQNGYLETPVDWIPAMRNIRLKDLPSFFRTTDADDILFNFLDSSSRRVAEAKALIINTFDELERPVLDALATLLPPPIYTVGPINLLSRHLPETALLRSTGANLWKEDAGCIKWLDGRDPESVVFVNFGSIAVMTGRQLLEFAWGLAGSGYAFLWVIRGDVVEGEFAGLPPEWEEETKGRGLVVSWCAQEEVLAHPAIGVFLTHAGWNSVLESFSVGVPILCWPFFAEQQTNCRYACTEWGVAMEIDNGVKRKEVEVLIGQAMEGEKGRELKKMAKKWEESASRAIEGGGSSTENFGRVVEEVFLH